MDKMFGAQFSNMMNEDIFSENITEDKIDQYTDLLMNQMIKKEILHEPLVDAKEKIEELMAEQNINPSVNKFSKGNVEGEAKEVELTEKQQKVVKQYKLICELIDLIELEETIEDKNIIKDKLEELYNEGGLPSELVGNDSFMQIFGNGGGSSDEDKLSEEFMNMMSSDKNPDCVIF
jgi:galactitol-specific phosphotransferase system IIB component